MTQGNYPGNPPAGQYGGSGGQYGPPPGQYGQAQGGPNYPGGAPARRSVGAVGLGLVVLGVAAALVGMFALDWILKVKFSDLHDAASADTGASSFAKLYYEWLGWALLAAAAVAGVVANLPNAVSGVFRALGALLGLGGAAITFYAIKLGDNEGSFSKFLDEAKPGFWLAVAGFAVIGIGALIGPRRV